MKSNIIIIGGGLAGVEAAWQIARRGFSVRLYEMRPNVSTAAHRTGDLAELVCSNSLKSDQEGTASHLLKEELRHSGSLLIQTAERTRVPAGHALAVDRELFAGQITDIISREPLIEIRREEAISIPGEGLRIIATGPLTSSTLSASIAEFAGVEHLYFYDAISPIIDATTIDPSRIFRASRYGKGGEDYLNCPMSKEEYLQFYQALISAESVPLRSFEQAKYFESCLPIEELARRGVDTLRFGPMKPVGLLDPATGRRPYAAVQLRVENLMADSYNPVGFQNHLTFPEQARVFRMIPGLEKAEFLRFGQIHRNTYLCAPEILKPTLQTRKDSRLLFAGQISGVEGYVESIATGLLAGINAARMASGRDPVAPPRETACGSLIHYLSSAPGANFQPVNASFGLLPDAGDLKITVRDRKERHRIQVAQALKVYDDWMRAVMTES